MPPLTETPNESRQPRRVYGRRRGLPETQEIHRQLFGTDNDDENHIEAGLANLSLSSKASSLLVDEIPVKRPPTASFPGQRLPQRTSHPSLHDTSQQPPALLQSTQCSTLKRDRSKHSHKSSSVPLTPSEQRQLQPLLSQPNVHSHVVSFPSFATRLLSTFQVSKSGEGSFSECLLLKHKANPSDVAILKIIPFDLSSPNSGAISDTDTVDTTIFNSTVEAVLREVQILSALSPYHGFAQLRSCHVVRGKWHDGFLEAYQAFRQNHPDLAVNPLPSERWHEDMIYGVIEMDNAGSDLESLARPSPFQVFDAFWMSVVLLAVVEKECQFEHRDLHMSNICYRERTLGKGYDMASPVAKTMREEPEILLGLTNLKITIIDYTMSRLRIRAEEEHEDRVLFNPRSAWSGKPPHYSPVGNDDSTISLQKDHQSLTGNRMRRLALQQSQLHLHSVNSHSQSLSVSATSSNSSSNTNNKWAAHLPQTNVLWLAHLLYQLLQQAGARPSHVPGSSACAKKVQTRMWKQLREVLAFVDKDEPEAGSTVEFLGIAIEKGWLKEEDVEGFKRALNDET